MTWVPASAHGMGVHHFPHDDPLRLTPLLHHVFCVRGHCDSMNSKEHWNQVYEAKAPDDVSWYQARPATSLKFIEATGVGREQGIIDVGGGASLLVDFLLDAGFKRLAVLDISAAALEHAKRRLGARVGEVAWFVADVTEFTPPHRFAVWHDRAVFHLF